MFVAVDRAKGGKSSGSSPQKGFILNEYEAKLNKALDIIRRFGPISRRDMFRKGFKLAERDATEVLRSLVDNGAIVALEGKADGPGRPFLTKHVKRVC